jgi:hypothetical protein
MTTHPIAKLEDLQKVLDDLKNSMTQNGSEHIADNFEAFALHYKAYTLYHAKGDLESASDQLGLILAKSDNSDSIYLETAVMIVLEAERAIRSYAANDIKQAEQSVLTVLAQASQLS